MPERYLPEEVVNPEAKKTPDRLRKSAQKAIGVLLKSFEIKGLDNLKTEPDKKYLIAGSHISNLDALAAVDALGDKFDLQIAVQSLLFKQQPHATMMKLAGQENFSPLSYRLTKDDRAGVFNLEDFKPIKNKMGQGKTPWIAMNPFTLEEKMRRAAIGPIILAHQTGAEIIPTALEIQGDNVSFEGGKKIAKALFKRQPGVFHVGEPIKLEPVNVDRFEELFNKKKNRQKLTADEIAEYKNIEKTLRRQMDEVGQTIAQMLPEHQRGYYEKPRK